MLWTQQLLQKIDHYVSSKCVDADWKLLKMWEITDICPHQAADECHAALLCLQACGMAAASSVLGLPADTKQCKWQLDSLHQHNYLVYMTSCTWQFC